jgi:hypothetical protein
VIASRRQAIGALLAACAFPAAAAPMGLASIATMIAPQLVNRTLDALFRHHDQIWSNDTIAIADFDLPSSSPRLFLVDMLHGTVTSLLVAHGSGSDPDHSGMLQSFSDAIGSDATAEGAYLVGDIFDGVHGRALRLSGLDATNAHAEERKIVIHAAWYANPEMIAKWGKLGRSDGCFSVGEHDIDLVLSRLGRGRLLYAGKADIA